MGKSRSSTGKAKTSGSCGECVWIWIGTKKKGKWVRDPWAQLLGIDCKAGCTCIDANTLGIQGKPFDRFIVMCKKRPHRDCDDCTCVYEYQGGVFVLQRNNCGTCGATCACTPPDMLRKWGKVKSEIKGLATYVATLCH